MVKTENHCVGCEVCGSCGADKTTVYYCDSCHEEVYHLNKFVDEQLCDDCIGKMMKEDFIDDILFNFKTEIREYLGISEVNT